MENMTTGVFRLKGSHLLKLGKARGAQNIHQISQKGGVSYPTTHRYFEKSEEVEAVSLRALYGVLVDGLGMSPAEVAALRFGDVFEAIPDVANGS